MRVKEQYFLKLKKKYTWKFFSGTRYREDKEEIVATLVNIYGLRLPLPLRFSFSYCLLFDGPKVSTVKFVSKCVSKITNRAI